jgi:hydrogenase maturation protein HypF
MLPRTPLEFILAEDGRRLLMIPEVTENLPVIGREKDAIAEYVEVADYFLLHDLPINVRMNLTMGYPHQGQAQYIRLGRGIIPLTIELEREFPHKTVAVGSDSNNAFCLAFGKEVVISHHIGWLKNYSAFQAFEEAIFHFYRLYRFTPELLVCDLHPDYISSSWAERQRIPQKRVQHHHAHIASCLAENGHFSRVLGIALDGGGYGVDGALWGGEFLVGGIPYGFKREGHIQYFPLPGGDAAIKEPWRIMIGLLWEIFRDHWRDNAPSEFLNLLPPDEVMVVEDMLKSGFNCRPTSACGRLFDAVASMVFAKNKFDYPSQGAIDFEGLLKKELREKDPELWEQSPYRYEIRRESPSILELSGLILGLLEDLRKGVSREEISFRFHLSMVTALKEMVIKIARRENIETIALSGGVFLNLHLLTWLKRLLEQDEFRVLTPQKLPTGDGGICLGQAVLANF